MSPSFQATLAEPLKFGHILEICAKAAQDATRITINLSADKSKANSSIDSDIGLQILIDFIKNQIVFSQVKSDDINNQVTKDFALCEFLTDFKFNIILAETKFHIALNNKPFVNFKYNHNLVKQEIEAVRISGNLDYIKQLDHRQYFPYTWPPIQITDDYMDFCNDQPMSFKPGHVMIITARLEGNTKGRFIIQFRHARDNKRQELHVSVRFDTKKIIRNFKRLQGDHLAFGQEEHEGEFPFNDFSKTFKIAVAFSETGFRIAKDGKFFCDYNYRSPNVLQYIVGAKVFGTNGVNVRVWGIHHLILDDPLCQDFEKHSVME